MLEHALEPPVAGVIWDGTGWGPDGTGWGGETLLAEPGGVRRVSHLRRFRLPGGETAVREPRRAALGVLAELFGESCPPVPGIGPEERRVFLAMIAKEINSPATSSAGRLFDAVAALCGLRSRCSHEAQAAMQLEAIVDPDEKGRYDVGPGGDWDPMVRGVLADLGNGEPTGRVAARVHASMAELVVQGARLAGTREVILSGGCFQNRVLAETAARRLREEGFRPLLHRVLPPNDGGLAAGQAASLGWS
jgi:hydrogenase maturation protein HypF